MENFIYQDFFFNFPLPVLVFERDGESFVLVHFNQVSEQTLGRVFDLTLNQDAEKIFPDVPDIVHTLGCCLSDSGRKKPESSAYGKLSFVTSPPKNVFIIIQDIKTQAYADTISCDKQNRFELAINATNSGLWDWDYMTGNIIFSDHWFTNLGYDPTEFDHNINAWEKLLHPDDKERVLKKLNEHLVGKTNIYQTEHRLLGKDGEWKWVLDTGRVVDRQENGLPLRVIGTKMEITKRKQLETELELLNTQLEALVEKRTRRLTEQKQVLLKTRKAMEEKSKHLEEVNNALKVLIKKSAENKEDVEKNIVSNINELVMPYLKKMNTSSGDQQKTIVKIIRSNLEEIAASFSLKLTSKSLHLSPAELRVANMIKHGSTTKDIAEILLLSPRTIETQRRMIRKKLGLIGKDINLGTYLHHLK